ncbi:purine-binding chemotaxis protein CheW [Nodosilinea sp. LEGE 07088]|uniref:chemotaxis protein CheW n=1 Tax=Nodosilinea sp. LEGE 07088 TaxID=2777968 RepID=UPI00187F7F83|nr:chemotaxis protein CheW [Nodosilinea sp. LEGE 07088]MBE9139482.1 purine-binding chemotaxis protein CheW [Nodosilinea sp. LEGE 07088]
MNNLSLVQTQPPGSKALASQSLTPLTHSYLRFNLGSQPALLPTRQVQEVIATPVARITPMPNMPPALLGLLNRRSRVLWVVDLALLLGLPTAYPTSQQYNLVLMQIGPVTLGLRVSHVEGILSLAPQHLQPAPAHAPPGLVPFLRGCVLQNGDVLLSLDGEALLRAPELQPL